MHTPTAIDDLYKLTLVDGLPVQADGKTLRYRIAHMRETCVADERAAQRLAERVMVVAGSPKLLVSEADFRYALTLRHIDALECDGLRIPQAMLDLDMLGKLSSHDYGLIEQRIFLLTLAAELRYGNISQEQFDASVAGKSLAQPGANAANAPQPLGEAASLGPSGPAPEPRPALLADYVGGAAAGAPARHSH